MPSERNIQPDYRELSASIKQWSRQLGFQQTGISDAKLDEAESLLQQWLQKNYHGDMHYMAKHGRKRSRPGLLIPGTLRIISVRMDYFPADAVPMADILHNPEKAFISRYALGRDYHKVLRHRLQKLAHRIQSAIGPFQYRVFSDSAPVLEKAIAEKAGLGWIGKHTNLINKGSGSWFFLGEIYTNLPLPVDKGADNHCGDCTACIDACPTQAIVGPYKLDARRCISYLTIEYDGIIPEELRPLMGNRIYGCDDCQMVCPWNRFKQDSKEEDFMVRHGLDGETLLRLFQWTETEFLQYTEGSAIRRIGYHRWQRNIAVALGNMPKSKQVREVLSDRRGQASEPLRQHINWALRQHE
ncbi:MAG TPA: tRNA epoxyqueuosine(34) reductase QueG [Acidiferrobacteraceae bacterium]|nr:tRNA epoxyqueuosine(34) reductase QueG [Acidiferrobacteraceae bacterium]HEX20593.1 tRNA epoxyqueuosine(34) reductase QueG [Acidiferrobacteraceae bacterium]